MENVKNKGTHKAMYFVAALIVIAVYNVIVFVLPFFKKHDGFWVGYGFSMAALLIATGIGLYTIGHGGLRSKVYRLPLMFIALGYLAIQLIAGFLQMVLTMVPFQYGIVTNTILLGGCIVGLIGVNVGKNTIERIDQKVKEKVFYIKSLQVDIESLADRVEDESLKKSLKALAETIRYSDPMSSPQLAALENKIEAGVAALAENIANINTANAMCDELQLLMAERNRKCKLLK